MHIVPVIDLQGGLVVHARKGERSRYRPIETPLARSAEPLDVAQGLLALHPFSAMYVADLDAIERRGDNRVAIAALRDAFPAVRLWVDGGVADLGSASAWLSADLGDLVLGSEALHDAGLLDDVALDRRTILSLDYRGEVFQGAPMILQDTGHWPARVIVMTLARVGSGAGPDTVRLREIVARAGKTRRVYAAGGVRNAEDLDAVAAIGCGGALVASALHDLRLAAVDLHRFTETKNETIGAPEEIRTPDP